ncbi:hypothetical protein PAXRUDRAFT_835300 [Paxillus rubicundulus Ve08.2h10]|uniref:Uncharacterized protein n=1 Tax=Paxillus rubicundulus Ve08.2h10 TaxID=930991 RepID=A0A0D0CZA0_9AGAM|nr:hypothetical protein PAXRUDRAFT_835300 [Paxillus rubicundulus Ve08.2h10]
MNLSRATLLPSTPIYHSTHHHPKIYAGRLHLMDDMVLRHIYNEFPSIGLSTER